MDVINKKISDSDALNILAQSLVKSSLFREGISALVPELLREWAGKNPFKRIMALPIKGSIRNSFKPVKDHSVEGGESGKDVSSIPLISSIINRIIEDGTEFISKTGDSDVSAKEELVDGILKNLQRKNRGRGITGILKIINEIHEDDPLFFSERIAPLLGAAIRNIDMGELYESITESRGDIVNLARLTGEELWKYPAKPVSMLAAFPALGNIIVSVAGEVLKPVNNMSPDLLSDVVISLIRDIDGKGIAELLNQLNELVRQVHSGSALLGEKGSPALPIEISRLAEDIISGVDLSLFVKSRILMDEIHEQIDEKLDAISEENPQVVKDEIDRYFRKRSSAIRSWSRRWEMAEDLFSDDELTGILDKGLMEFDSQEAGETLNRIMMIVNRVLELKPDIVTDVLSQAVDTLDPYELNETVRLLMENLTMILKPVAGSLMPHLLRSFTELCTPDEGDEFSDDMNDALQGFRSLIVGKEALHD